MFVFRDGTCRFDATDIPLTEFKPSELSVTVEEMKKLGYTHDMHGKPLQNAEQTLSLQPQDIIPWLQIPFRSGWLH